MFCPNCGTRLPDRARFCTTCGARAASAGTNRSPQASGISDTSPLPIINASSVQPRQAGLFTPETVSTSHNHSGSLLPLMLVAIVAIVAIAFSAAALLNFASSGQAPKEPTQATDTDSAAVSHEPTAVSPDTEALADVSPTDYDDTFSDTRHTNEYVLSDSSARRYTAAELSPLSDWELYLARNEIYARHGREFANADLQRHFEATSWYRPSYTPEEFDASASDLLSDVERVNIDTILSIEQERGSAYL